MTVYIVMGYEQYGSSWIEQVFVSQAQAEAHAAKLSEAAEEEGLDLTNYYVTERDVIEE